MDHDVVMPERETFPRGALPGSLWRRAAERAGVGWPLRAVDTARFLAAVRQNQLSWIAAADPDFPEVARPEAARQRGATLAQDLARDAEVDALLRLARQVLSGHWVAVHGADFRRRLYPSTLQRLMKDVDILVAPDAIDAAEQAMIRAALRPAVHGRRGRERRLDTHVGTVWLDLYGGLLPDARVDLDLQELWSECVPGTDGIPRLALHHAIAVHALSLSQLQYGTHLRKFVDFWLLTRDDDAVVQAMDCARRWNMRRAAYASFAVLGKLFPEDHANACRRAAQDLVSSRERQILEAGIISHSPLEERVAGLRQKLLLLDSPRHRAIVGMTFLRTLPQRIAAATPPRRRPSLRAS